jgi:nicotinate-nucleotide adenylyltransferase
VTTVVGIFGGSFDPVHAGHVAMASAAIASLRLDRLLVVPARASPHKSAHPAAPAEARLAMLRLAFAGTPAVDVSDLELRRPPPSYTVDTVEEVARLHPGADLVLLLGMDALADFPRWRDTQRIVRACRLAVFRRPGAGDAALAEARRAVPGLRIEGIDAPLVDVSSTAVRERVRAGLPLDGLVPGPVGALIEERALYR